MSTLLIGWAAGLATIPTLALALRILFWLRDQQERLLGYFVYLRGVDDESYPERTSGSIRRVRRIARVLQVGYYRHGHVFESRWVALGGTRFALSVGRKRPCRPQTDGSSTHPRRPPGVPGTGSS